MTMLKISVPKYLLGSMLFFACNFAWAQSKTDTTLARQYLTQAQEAYEKADYPTSIELYERTAQLYLKNGMRGAVVNTKLQKGRGWIRQGRFAETETLLQTIQTEYADQLAAMSPTLADWYVVAGETQLNKGRNDLALEDFQKALAIYEKRPTEKRALATAYSNLSILYWNTGNRQLAEDYQLKALAIRQSIFKTNHPELAASYNDLGLIYTGEDIDKAQENYQRALDIYQKVYEANHPKIAIAFINLAITYRQEGEYEKALDNLDKALAIWQNVHGQNHPTVAFVFNNIGQVYFDKKEYSLALEYQEKALSIYQKIHQGKHPEVANTFNLIGNIYRQQQKFSAALRNYQQAIIANVPNFDSNEIYENPDGASFYNVDILLGSLLNKAQTLEEQHFGKTLKFKDLEYSLATLELCDKLIENIRRLRVNKSDKIALGVIASEVYEYGIRACLAMRDVTLRPNYYEERAFYFAEKSKSAVLLSAISDTDAKQYAGIPADLLAQEKTLKVDIALYEQRLADKPNATDEKIFRDKLFSLNEQYRKFITDLEAKYPEYYNLKYNVNTAKITELKSALPKETALLNYFIADKAERIYIFQITASKLKIYDLPKDKNLDKNINALRNAIKYSSKKVFTESAKYLYQQLLPKSTAQFERLIIIPDGRLGTIPFEALLTDKNTTSQVRFQNMDFLAKKQAISYAYSTNLFYQQFQKNKKNTNNAAESILLIAPVNFENNKDLHALPATELEVMMIQNLFKEKNKTTTCYVRQQAKEPVIKSTALKNFGIIHISSHGVVNEENPELSQIFLLPDRDGKEDGNLFSGEIYNLEIRADLFTLSCCETGLGKLSKGEGIVGLTRALLYAGAQNILVSLWAVADQSTADLMRDFYKNYLQNNPEDFSKALREAKLKMMQGEQYAAPYFWAPFVLVGQ
jgi:CHAT domain-containing protein